MERDDNSLEKKSKEFLKSRIKEDPENFGFNPGEMKNFSEKAPLVNYLLEKKYLVEKDPINGEVITVKSVRYILTNLGRVWTYR